MEGLCDPISEPLLEATSPLLSILFTLLIENTLF